MKKRTWVTRLEMKYRLGIGATRCPICGKLLGASGFDMHEALFPRSDLQGVEWQDEIFHPYNCIGVCHGPCHVTATGEWGKLQAAKSLLSRYDFDSVKDWILSLPFKTTSVQTEAINLLLEAQNGKAKETSHRLWDQAEVWPRGR